jgi:uncharacterized metal-binding protein YceD (DUF177 family)
MDTIGPSPRAIAIEAEAGERKALAKRFALPAIDHLSAELSLTRTGEHIQAYGRLRAEVTQSCVATREPVKASLDEPFEIIFTPQQDAQRGGEEEIELSESDCDVVFYEGASIDVGEAVAETLSLSLDPWPRAPGAVEVLRAAGVKSEADVGPFAALAGLRDKLGK